MLKIGDIVSLKSGGPKMTVIGRGGPKSVKVAWFSGEIVKNDEKNIWKWQPQLHRDVLPIEALTVVKP